MAGLVRGYHPTAFQKLVATKGCFAMKTGGD